MTNKEDLLRTPIGTLVARDFNTTRVFKQFGLDFCCHGQDDLATACRRQQADADEVVRSLELLHTQPHEGGSIPFASWPLDLLMDYILKIHHRGIRTRGPQLLELVRKVAQVHGNVHPELLELQQLIEESLTDLEAHLQKEEQVLFPYLYELFEVSAEGGMLEPMHCGSIANPIRVMHLEHEHEGDRYLHIRSLTDNFTTPADGCASYRLMMQELEVFVDALFEHIHLENNILFPEFLKLEERHTAGGPVYRID